MKDDRRDNRFDLGDFVIAPEVASLLSYADLARLLARHSRGDWGEVSLDRRKKNETSIHPRHRRPGLIAQSVHLLKNSKILILTLQGKRRRSTRLSLL